MNTDDFFALKINGSNFLINTIFKKYSKLFQKIFQANWFYIFYPLGDGLCDIRIRAKLTSPLSSQHFEDLQNDLKMDIENFIINDYSFSYYEPDHTIVGLENSDEILTYLYCLNSKLLSNLEDTDLKKRINNQFLEELVLLFKNPTKVELIQKPLLITDLEQKEILTLSSHLSAIEKESAFFRVIHMSVLRISAFTTKEDEQEIIKQLKNNVQ